jgi:hypothetical protein
MKVINATVRNGALYLARDLFVRDYDLCAKKPPEKP